MSDTTINRPIIQDSDLHFDTVVYRVCKPRVRAVEINIFDEIAAILNFRASGLRVAREIIKRQHGENITVSISDAELAEALWPDLPGPARNSKLVRSKKNWLEDQIASGFQYAYKLPRDTGITKNGKYYGKPSKYRPGHYWNVSDELRNRSNEKDREFLSFSAFKCRKIERELLTEILDEFGFKKITRTREKSEKEKKEKPASLPLESNGITVSWAMHELQKMARAEQFQFVKDFTETATSHLIADSQDYDEGAHIFSKVQTAALIGGKHSLDDLRGRIAKHNSKGRTVKPGMRAAALRASLDESGALLLKCEQLAALCESSDAIECAEYFSRWAASLRDFRWAISEDRKGKAA